MVECESSEDYEQKRMVHESGMNMGKESGKYENGSYISLTRNLPYIHINVTTESKWNETYTKYKSDVFLMNTVILYTRKEVFQMNTVKSFNYSHFIHTKGMQIWCANQFRSDAPGQTSLMFNYTILYCIIIQYIKRLGTIHLYKFNYTIYQA